MSRTATVVDSDGDVWTGKVCPSSNSGQDLLFAMVTGGAGLLGVAADAVSERVTVEVNGEKHTGQPI